MRQLNDALHKAKLPEQQAYKLIHLCIHTFYVGGCGDENLAGLYMPVSDWMSPSRKTDSRKLCYTSTPLYLSGPSGSCFLIDSA